MVPSFAYDAQGGLVRSDYGNGTTNCRWYDARHRVVGRKAAPTTSLGCVSRESDSTAFQQLAYGYTVHGLLESVVDKTAPRADGVRFDATYQYDRLYELTAATTAEGTVGYRYDVIQNLISQTATQADTGLPLGDFKYGEAGAGPNAVTRAGRESFGYDAAGRMREYHGFALEWDAQDKLVSATRADGSRVENYYGFDGERVVEVVRRPGKAPEVHRYVFGDYLLHGAEPTWVVSAGAMKVAEVSETAGLVPTLGQLDELVAYSLDTTRRPLPASRELLDFDGNGTLADGADLAVAARRYVEGAAGGKPARVWRYYHEDQLGAPTHVSDSAGEWASATRFHPYGRPYGQRGERAEYGFAGSQREPAEELGLTRMGARWYAPDIGRWASPDPLYQVEPTKALESPMESGLYGYVRNNPVNLADPSGLGAPAARLVPPDGESVAEAAQTARTTLRLLSGGMAAGQAGRAIAAEQFGAMLGAAGLLGLRYSPVGLLLFSSCDGGRLAAATQVASEEWGSHPYYRFLGGGNHDGPTSSPDVPGGAGTAGETLPGSGTHRWGPEKGWADGAEPNSKWTQTSSDGTKAVQNTIYDASGRAVGQVDFKSHGSEAPPGHGHILSPGKLGSGHGEGATHIPPEKVPAGWADIPKGLEPAQK